MACPSGGPCPDAFRPPSQCTTQYVKKSPRTSEKSRLHPAEYRREPPPLLQTGPLPRKSGAWHSPSSPHAGRRNRVCRPPVLCPPSAPATETGDRRKSRTPGPSGVPAISQVDPPFPAPGKWESSATMNLPVPVPFPGKKRKGRKNTPPAATRAGRRGLSADSPVRRLRGMPFPQWDGRQS